MSIGRPPGPKKLAAIEQMNKLKAAKIPDAEIRQALILSGLTKAQAIELLPLTDEEKPRPAPLPHKDAETRAAIVEGAIHFLETIAKRLTPDVCDRFKDVGSVKGDALTWARKLRGAL